MQMPFEDNNALIMQNYESLIKGSYKEPNSTSSLFKDATDEILKELMSSSDEDSDSDNQSYEDPVINEEIIDN